MTALKNLILIARTWLRR